MSIRDQNSSSSPMRVRVLEAIVQNFKGRPKMENVSMTGADLHAACLEAIKNHPGYANRNRQNEPHHFPAGVGANLVDTIRYWLSGDNYTYAWILWNEGLHSQLNKRAMDYFHMVNGIQNDALKVMAKELGDW